MIGVEPAAVDTLRRSLGIGKPVELPDDADPSKMMRIDGLYVPRLGDEVFRICNELVDEMVTVSNDEICAAIKDGFTETRCVLEPAGALAIAGIKKWVASSNVRDMTYVVIASGANMDFDRLRFVSERADASETLMSVEIPEKAGSFRRFISHIEPRNISEFSYRYGDDARASILASFQAG